VRRTVAFTIALLVVAVAAQAKPAEDSAPSELRIQQARQASASGDVADAVEIYRQILEEDPENERAFWGLVGLYSSSGMEQEELIPLLERRVEERPHDTQAKMELGRVHARIGNHELAHELWTAVLEHGTPDVGRYTDIGSLEIRHRMYEQALATFIAGRAVFRSESLFSQELTQVHTALGDFDAAIDECVVTVNQHGGAAAWATNLVELMLEQGAGRGEVGRKMDAIARDEGATARELGFAGSVFLALDRPERALRTFLRADEVAGGEGRELLGYAEILADEGRSEQAREAYLMVVERHPGAPTAASAGIAAAGILAESGEPEGAVAELRTVADAFDGLSWGAQALFDAARIELDVLGDASAALSTVAELRDRFRGRDRGMNEEATLIEVDAYMRQGRLADAHERADTLVREGVRDSVVESAMFALGLTSFLAHDYGRATEEFRELVKSDAAGVLVNDALRLMLAMANAQESGDTGPIGKLADAHAARISGDTESSRRILLELVDVAADESVRDEALLLLGAAAAQSGDAREAVEHYDRIIEASTAITARAEAMMRKADILRHELGRTSEAADQYLAILEDLPSNVLSGEARRKLDALRRGEGT
jgi:tetratricopeptide (TPR) repeat protein